MMIGSSYVYERRLIRAGDKINNFIEPKYCHFPPACDICFKNLPDAYFKPPQVSAQCNFSPA